MDYGAKDKMEKMLIHRVSSKLPGHIVRDSHEFGEGKDGDMMTSSAPAAAGLRAVAVVQSNQKVILCVVRKKEERLTLGRDKDGKPLVQRSFSMSFTLFTLL